MVVGKQVKDCWGKKGGGENEKGENDFPPSYFFPKSSERGGGMIEMHNIYP